MTAALRDGSTVDVRPLRADDEPALAGFLRALSVGSRRLRFCGAVGDAGLALEARREAHVDDVHGYGLVATAGPQGRIVGHAEYTGLRGDHAEASFAVADEYQGKGLGTILVRRLAEAAAARAVGVLEAFVMPENFRMLAVFRDCGLPARVRAARGEVRVELRTASEDPHVDVAPRVRLQVRH